MLTKMRLHCAIILCLAGSAAAAQTYGVSIQNNKPDLGRVVSAASGTTVFRIEASTGSVTRISGSGVRMTPGSTRARVTISCGDIGSCNTRKVNVKIGSVGSPGGRAGSLTNFDISMGTASLDSAPTGTNPVSFTLDPIGKNASKTFWVGADFPIEGNTSGDPTGTASSGFYVYATRYNNTASMGDSAEAVATVLRPINVVKHSDLIFGRIVRPTSGTGTVTVTPLGVRQLTNAVGLATPGTTAASYTVDGEGGQAISVSIPETFTIVGPSGNLTVETSTDAVASPTLSAAIGSGGSYSFKVGGSLQITPTTVTGSYQGVFNVAVDYN